MELTFDSFITYLSGFFGGSTTLSGLAILLVAWMIAAVICAKSRAPPTYSVIPMIPLCIFMAGYGVLNETVCVIIILVTSVLVASEFKKVVD